MNGMMRGWMLMSGVEVVLCIKDLHLRLSTPDRPFINMSGCLPSSHTLAAHQRFWGLDVAKAFVSTSASANQARMSGNSKRPSIDLHLDLAAHFFPKAHTQTLTRIRCYLARTLTRFEAQPHEATKAIGYISQLAGESSCPDDDFPVAAFAACGVEANPAFSPVAISWG